MSFEEMQAILQGILLSQQQFQSEIGEMKALADSNSQTVASALQLAQSNNQAIASTREAMESTRQIVQSNSRAIQAMLDQAVTDRLVHEEQMQKHTERIQLMENISAGLVNLSASIDEDRPTILRMLNAIDRKTDAILNQLPPQDV
jgi:hypothetical protein